MQPDITAFVGVGSNLGDRCQHLCRAFVQLQKSTGISGLRSSSVYQSKAVGPGKQPDYLNAVFELRTWLAPHALLDLLQSIENAAGRVRIERWGARTLDLDLLLHGKEQSASERLALPHPRIADRNFVVYPLYDLDPLLILPGGTSVAVLRQQLTDEGLRPFDFDLQDHAAHA